MAQLNFNMEYINLISDSFTIPTKEMKQCILNSHIGDDIFQTDPSVLKLEKYVASLFNKEDGVFVPTRSMANQIAIMYYSQQQKGVEVICGIDDHISNNGFAEAQLITLKQNEFGQFDLEQLKKVIRKVDGVMYPETKLIALQSVYKNGNALNLEYMQQVKEIANQYKKFTHLDGANIFNQVEAINEPLENIGTMFDSIQVSLNKGLCCTLGSVLVGSGYFCEKAKKIRKIFGGSMRQSGLIAAQCQHAFQQIYPLIKFDNEAAKILSEKLNNIQKLNVQVYQPKISTNVVIFSFKNDLYNVKNEFSQKFIDFMENKKILIREPLRINNQQVYKIVTHYYIRKAEIDEIEEQFKQFMYTIYEKETQ